MRWAAAVLVWSLVGTLLTASERAGAEEAAPAEGENNAPAAVEAEAPKSRWHGSIVHFDQSVGTQTVGIGADYQSANPTYEWWFALKPRYYVYESRVESVSLNAWGNFYWEPTNSDTTTYRNELVVGPTWLWANYGRTIFERGDAKTLIVIGPRLKLPTDKESRNAGLITSVGAGAGIGHAFPILGRNALVLPSGKIGFEARYYHPFSRSTTHVYPGLNRVRQDVAGRTVISDLVDGSMNAQHELWLLMTGGVRITEKLGLTLTYVLINYWDYRPPEVPICTTSTGCVMPSGTEDPTRYRVRPWALVSIDYDVIDEMSLSLGYYNLTSQIGPNGQRRSPFWSPDARIFFTIVGNLDAIYETLANGKSKRINTGRVTPAGSAEPSSF
jgi:hypothetical protein